MAQKRVHIVSAVNAGNVSKASDPKAGDLYTIREVCGAVDGIVMHNMVYEGAELAAGVVTLEGKPAPAGHPKNNAGQFVSALSGDALLYAHQGAVCRNARHEGGRTLVDVVVNAAAAKAHPDGARLIDRLDAAINGTNAEPIHVSTGLLVEPIEANGESRGKKYTRKATKLNYDHLAILLNERGAGTPEDGVGMFLNAAGAEEPVEVCRVEFEPEDKRTAGWRAWLNRLLFRRNAATELSFDQIREGLWAALRASAGEGAWVQEVFDRYAIWSDRDGKLYRQDYSIASDGSSVAFSGTAQEVRREVTYQPVANRQETDTVKDQIVAALNKAGIQVAGKTDEQLLADFVALNVSPVQAQLVAANGKIADHEKAQRDAETAEVTKLATALAANSNGLTVDDFRVMPVARLRELSATAAPVLAGNSRGGQKSAYADYDPNEHFDVKKEAA